MLKVFESEAEAEQFFEDESTSGKWAWCKIFFSSDVGFWLVSCHGTV